VRAAEMSRDCHISVNCIRLARFLIRARRNRFTLLFVQTTQPLLDGVRGDGPKQDNPKLEFKMGSSRVAASAGRVMEMTVCLMAAAIGGLPAGAAAGNGWIRGFLRSLGLLIPVTDETAAKKRSSDLWMAGVRLNLGRASGIWDLVLRGIPVSVKAGQGVSDVTMHWQTVRAMVEANAPLWILNVRGDSEAIPAGYKGEVQPARNVEGRWVNLTPVLARLGDEVWESPGEKADGRMAHVRTDRKWLRLSVDFSRIRADEWLTDWSSDFLSADLGEAKWESADASVVASSNGVEVFDSGRVTVGGADTEPMRPGLVSYLTSLIKAGGEPVQPPNRTTTQKLREALGDAGGRVVSVRGKGQRWEG